MNIDLEKFIKHPYIKVAQHPFLPLLVLNYTKEAQYERAWDEYTRMARGLIVDTVGNIVARPFPKFFNLNETSETMIENLPADDPVITEKLDGSLGILYFGEYDQPYISTRGSFVSEQAQWATTWINRQLLLKQDFKKGYTYLWEILYPQNQVVVDYGGRSECVLLAVISTETGVEDVDLEYEATRLNVSWVKPFALKIQDAVEKSKQLGLEQEGFVARYANGLRVKIKGDEYTRYHKLISNFSSLAIWDLLRNGGELEEIIPHVPVEFKDWAYAESSKLLIGFSEIAYDARQVFLAVKDTPTRREQAIWLKENVDEELLPIVFNMLDKKDYSKYIWKLIRPSYEVFKRVEDN